MKIDPYGQLAQSLRACLSCVNYVTERLGTGSSYVVQFPDGEYVLETEDPLDAVAELPELDSLAMVEFYSKKDGKVQGWIVFDILEHGAYVIQDYSALKPFMDYADDWAELELDPDAREVEARKVLEAMA